MQFTYMLSILKERNLSVAWKFIRLAILISCITFIAGRLNEEELLLLGINSAIGNLTKGGWLLILLVVALGPVNWMTEALKWKILTEPIQKVTLFQAFISVLSGLTFGFITPREIGGYIGRILIFDDNNKPKVLLPLLISRLAQLIPTLIFGTIGIYYFSGSVKFQNQYLYISVALLILTILFFVIVVPMTGMIMRIVKNRFGTIVKQMLSSTGEMNTTTILQVIGLSVSRYIIFGSQFLILMIAFGVEGETLLLIAGISWIFLAKSIIPSFSFLGDLGIREFSALIFFGSFDINIVPVLSASLFIWILNIALPSVVGLFFINKTKI